MAEIKRGTTEVAANSKGKISMSGSKSLEFTHIIANQALSALWTAHSNQADKDRQVDATLAVFKGIEPQDEIEAMLVTQMIACHSSAMECYRRSMIEQQSFEGRNQNLNYANKLSRSYASLMEAFNRHRGKGQQKVTVEHVTVNAGGQAIVGNVNHPGGGDKQEIEEQPHAKEISDTPMQEMPDQNPQRKEMPVASNA